LLRTLSPDLILLQEVNPGSAEVLGEAAAVDWLIRAVDLRSPEPDDRPVRSRGVAIAGRGQPPHRAWLPAAVPLPERILIAQLQSGGLGVTAVSYHAPPGVNWGLIKPRQAVAFASWLGAATGPVILGADANTPKIDAADFALTRTHWHTGARHLRGEPGDDLLFGPGKIHGLDDALRRWLAGHPDVAAAAAADRPRGPIVITHRTGKRRNSPGTGRRFDSIWVTPHWAVEHIDHLYNDAIRAGSDHAIVLADLAPRTMPATATPPRSNRPARAARPDPPTPLHSGAESQLQEYCQRCGYPFVSPTSQQFCSARAACDQRLREPGYRVPKGREQNMAIRDATLAANPQPQLPEA